jgi:hypothetical protein
MPLSATLLTLANYLTGEFENREQAIAEPVWYVHLRLWQRPVALFADDSVTLFAEQASIVNLNTPYRQRLMRLQADPRHPAEIQVQYYALKDPEAMQGAGQDPARLNGLTLDHIERLPGCLLQIASVPPSSVSQPVGFQAFPAPECRCFFQYQGQTREVVLGFEVSANEYLTYDKGVDPETGRALWGAMMGPYRYCKVG